jgi:hypothetical protein
MKTTNLSKGLILFLAISFSILSNSCRKEDDTCFVVIKVVRLDGLSVSGANVKLTSNFANTNGTNPLASYLPAVKVTDSEGKAEFQFKYQAILDAEASSVFGNGATIVKLQPGETVSKTIVIQ